MMDGQVPPIDVRYCYEDLDRHGNVRRYFRKRIEGTKKYRKVRIRAEPGTEEFHRQFVGRPEGCPNLLRRAVDCRAENRRQFSALDGRALLGVRPVQGTRRQNSRRPPAPPR
jgi:hypothetical protein